MSQTRIHFMDPMRSILMMLGVVVHTAQIYSPSQSWYIHSENPTSTAGHIIDFIHLFRMPAFFVIAGFFCFLTLKKASTRDFIKTKCKRILLPFVSTAIILNSLQIGFLEHMGWQAFEAASYLTGGGWIGHLWFLINLMCYFVLAAWAWQVGASIITKVNNIVKPTLSRTPIFVVVLLLPVVWICIHALKQFGIPIYSTVLGEISIYSLLIYLPYFLVGIVLASNRELMTRFVQQNTWLCIIGLALCFGAYHSPAGDISVIKVYLHTLSIWLSVVLIFKLFHHFFNQGSALWVYLSGASYTTYLFHNILVILVGCVMIHYNVSALAGMCITIVTTTIITLAIHKYLVSRNKTLQLLFNGK